MNGYPRRDGTWTFYVIESQYEHKPETRWGRYNWVHRFDNPERAEALGFVYEEVTLQERGVIWQQSGINGTPSLEYARILLRLCQRDVPEHRHRIVKRTVTRTTEEVPEHAS